MRQSKLFAKTRKEAPKDEVAKNAELLIRAGFINKEMSGVYSYLPLGLRTLKKIENIIREEMNREGGVELLLPSLHPKENWVKTGRWESMDDLYKITDASGREAVLGATHEEIITPLAKFFVSSYKDLPIAPYQFQTKFRMELRSKSGILRGREFIMKDMYSFHTDSNDLDQYYERIKEAYARIFERVGIGSLTYLTFASGGTFSKYSHEFQTATEAGEDIIYVDEKRGLAVNREVYTDEVLADLGLSKEQLVEKKAIEVGNIFKLGTKFSSAFDLTYKDEDGKNIEIVMGCYGIGLGRLMGTVVEASSDERGIIWPEAIAPFKAHLILLGNDESVRQSAEALYEKLQKNNIEILFDDRDRGAGEKFADADLIGIPYRIVVSDKNHEKGLVELKRRSESESALVGSDALLGKLNSHV